MPLSHNDKLSYAILIIITKSCDVSRQSFRIGHFHNEEIGILTSLIIRRNISSQSREISSESLRIQETYQ